MRELPSTEWLREFQKKLHAKAKAEPKFRFYTLYDKTYRIEVLEEAYRKAKSNGGACGVDGETFEDVQKKGVAGYLAELQLEMKERRYVPQPVRRVYIPKPNGKERPLGIPTIRDRIVQTAFLLILEPIFEADFADSSYGFRQGKSAHDAVREIYKYLNWGCVEVYDVDLEKYFDTVDHGRLMKLIARRISDAQILHVIRQWLNCGYVEDGQHRQSTKGTPQGGVISPLLANIYLNPVDQAFKRGRLGTIRNGSIHLVRYADDSAPRRRGKETECWSPNCSLAAQEMRVGPSGSDCRIRAQTTASCSGPRAGVASVAEKAEQIRQVRLTKANASEPLQTCRKRRDAIKTGLQSLVREEVREKPTDCPSGGRHQRRREREQKALVRNVGTCTLS